MRGLIIGIVLTALLSATTVSAQPEPPRLVQSEDGALWVIMGGQRFYVTPEPIAADALGAIPDGSAALAAVASIAAPASQPSAEAAVTFSGAGSQNTRLFGLAGGNYTARWNAKPNGSSGSCYVGARLKSASNTSVGTLLVNQALQAGVPRNGETQLYRVAAGGDYYIDANTTCSWEITITPQ